MRKVSELVAARQAGHGLAGSFYHDETIYQRDIEKVWRKGWVFAGHSCEIPEAGDYFTLNVDTDSILVIRGDQGEVNAFYNVCRHRGTLLCSEPEGRTGRIVCPYHQWTYGRDGGLLSCRGMQDLDHSQLGLKRVQSQLLEGLIYISLAAHPLDFSCAADLMGPVARPQGLGQAKIAAVEDYHVAANWKIVWENNRECYHCNVNHPQYIKANYDHYNSDDTSERIQQQIEVASLRSEQKWAAKGLAVTHKETGMTCFPDADRNLWYSANRTVLADGYVSETMDGKQVAPLMGDYDDPDVGTVRMRTMPNFWNHSSCDHAVSTRLLPTGPRQTHVRVWWLVDEHAEQGVDYQLDEIMPFWQLTSEQDWEICERVQCGVESRGYEPGPFSTAKEYNVDSFVRWYLKQITV